MFNFLNSEACICTVSDLETIRGYAADAKGHLKTALIGKCPCTSQGLQAHAARALHTMCILPAVYSSHRHGCGEVSLGIHILQCKILQWHRRSIL